MKIERVIYPVIALGPSKRVGVWTIGCIHNCKGCINPELQVTNSSKSIEIKTLAQSLINLSLKNDCHSITFTGGDPMYQKEELKELLRMIRPYYNDILVYTGYLIASIDNSYLSNIDVLIDGRYEDNLNTCDSVLRGSSNQKINYLNINLKEIYEKYMENGRVIQNVMINGTLISVGIHNKLGGKDEI